MNQEPSTNAYHQNGNRMEEHLKKKSNTKMKNKAEKVLKLVDKVQSIVCKHKDKVLSLLGRKRYSRNFLQTKNRGIFQKAKELKKALSSVKDLKQVFKSVKDAKGTIDFLKENLPVMNKCFKTLKQGKLVKTLKKTGKKLKKLFSSGAKGIAKTLLNKVVCNNWNNNRKAVKSLLFATYAKGKPRKYFFFSRFVGLLINAATAGKKDNNEEKKTGDSKKKKKNKNKKNKNKKNKNDDREEKTN